MRNIPYENDGFDILCLNGGSLMKQFIKAMRPVFCSLLFIAMACESFAVFGSSLKRIESYKLQAADSDNLREAWKKALSATYNIKSFRLRIEDSNASKASTTIIEYTSPDSIREIRENREIIWIGKSTYYKKGDGPWEKYPEKNNSASVTDLPARVLIQYIKDIKESDEAQFIGRDSMDGIPALVYQHKKYYGSDKSSSITTKTWFNEADGLLLKNHIYRSWRSSPAEPVDYTLYDYNADIKIEPPAEYVSVTGPRAPMVPISPTGIESIGQGLGTGKGGGIGSGDGTGLGPGQRSNPPATSVDQRPVPLNLPRPNYTEEARNNKVQGVIRVRALVGVDGNVEQVRLITGLPDGLNKEALRCAFKSRFKPAMKDGKPVRFWVSLDIEFNLR